MSRGNYGYFGTFATKLEKKHTAKRNKTDLNKVYEHKTFEVF